MENENQKQTKPRIYVASLADYNSGRRLGIWIDATQEATAIHADNGIDPREQPVA